MASQILSGMLARPRTGSLEEANTYRKYASVLSSEAVVNGAHDVSNKLIQYEIGVRHKSVQAALVGSELDRSCPVLAYNTSNVLSDLFLTLSKKFSNFSHNFEACHLSGVVERIAKGLAADSAYSEGVRARDLLGGRGLRVHALGNYFGPISLVKKRCSYLVW